MIPKIIHYCWLSGDKYPKDVKACINSWKKKLPDYEIRLWDLNRFPIESNIWVKEAFQSKKYAFAADYIRLYALYTYGGIYLDSDVEVLKPFDDLLDLPYFIGKENSPSGIEAATLGFEKGNKLLEQLLKLYENRHFILQDGSFDIKAILPYEIRSCIDKYYKYNEIQNKEDFSFNETLINVFPVDFFSPKEWYSQKLTITDNTYSIHHFASSWMPDSMKPVRKNSFRKLLDGVRVKLALGTRIRKFCHS